MPKAVLLISFHTIEYGGSSERSSIPRGDNTVAQLIAIGNKLIRRGVTQVRVLAPDYIAEVEKMKAHFPRLAFEFYNVIDVIGPRVRLGKPVMRVGEFQAHSDFGIVWCNIRGEDMHLLAYKAISDSPTSRLQYKYQDDVAAHSKKIHYVLEMAKTLRNKGLADIAFFVPEDNDDWRARVGDIARQLNIRAVAFIAPDMFRAILSLPS
jgi:hypothetical protein